MDAVEDVVAGEDHALLFYDHRRLVECVSGHVNHLEGMVAHVHGHGLAEGEHRRVGLIAFQQRGLVRPESADPGDMLGHICFQDACSDSLVCDNRRVEEGVSRPVVAVGLGVDDIAEQPPLLDLRLQPHGCGGLVGAVDHDDAV